MVMALSASVFAEEGTQELKVVTEPSFAPFEYIDKNDSSLIGFDIDLIKAIAEVQGFKVEVKSMGFDAQIPAVLTHQVDIAISGFTITEERAKSVNFSEPYYDAGLGILINKADKDTIKAEADLQGKPLCAQIGTSGAIYASKIKDADVVQYNSTAEAFLELGKGSCAAVVSDKPVIEYYIANTKNDSFYMLPVQLTVEQYGIVTAKDNPELSKSVSEGLKKIRENGTYDKIYKKWFGEQSK